MDSSGEGGYSVITTVVFADAFSSSDGSDRGLFQSRNWDYEVFDINVA